MAYFKQTEFAALIGKTRGWVSTYIGRGKIIKSGDVIDTSEPVNIAIMKKFGVYPDDGVSFIIPPPVERKKRVSKKKEPIPNKKVVVKKTVVKPTPTKKPPIIAPPSENTGGQYQLDLDKKEAELEFKQVSTRIKLIEESKLRGELIKVDDVSKLISTLSRSIITSYKDSMDLFLIEINHRAKISDKFAAELKGEMITLINKAHDTAIDKAIKSVSDITPKITDDESK